MWRTNSKLAVERNIGDFKLPETDDHSPTDYVLDGQQRITVIYSCLGAPTDQPGFAAGYDLDAEEFVELDEENTGSRIFPMRWVFSTTELLNFRTGLLTLSGAAAYQAKLDAVIKSFTSYRLPVVILKELSVEEVCPIFERINSAGTKLSMFDLMVAATWSPRFDLNEVSKKMADSMQSKGFETIDPTTILKCLSAIHHKGLKKAQLLSLRNLPEQEMTDLVERAKAAIIRAVDLLSTEFRIQSWDFLPYEALLIVLAFICSRLDRLDAKHLVRIRQWFWRASLNERYRVGGEGFVSKDLETVAKFVIEDGDANSFGVCLNQAQILNTSFRANNSRSRAFILALAAAHPRNLTNGAAIDTEEALSQFNKKQFHHIYPKAHLDRSNEELDENSIANICMLAASENNSISDSDPQEYIPRLLSQHGATAAAIFNSNLMPLPPQIDYTSAAYGVFLSQRASLIVEYFKTLCGGQKLTS